MKRGVMKNATWYALIALLVAVAILPLLKAMAPQLFPEGFNGGHRSAGRREGFEGEPAPVLGAAAQPPNGCDGAPCSEGQFCGQDKKCWPIYVGGANGSVPEGSE